MTTTADSSVQDAITGTWAIDPTHTTIGFSIRHAMIAKVRGNFGEFEGTFVIDGADVTASTASLSIQAASFSTDNADRDESGRFGDDLEREGIAGVDLFGQ